MKFALLAGGVLLANIPHMTYAASIEAGKEIFNQICSHCHYTNYDEKFGPGLAGIGERRDVAWLDMFLKNPKAMIRNDGYARNLQENNAYNLVMPTFPEMQDETKRADIIAYLKTLK